MRLRHGLAWVWLAMVAALLVVPIGTATADLPDATTAAISACTAHNSPDTCMVSGETATSVTVTQTINPDNTVCPGGGSSTCVFQYHLGVVQTGYNNIADHAVAVGSASTNCAGTIISGSGDFPTPPAGFTCTTIFSWGATEYPISWSVSLLEENGDSNPVPSGGGHQATFNRPSLIPTASFTYAQTSTPGQFVFTSTSLQGSGPLEERWFSPDDHSQSPAPQRTWTHTFAAPGTYTINLEVSDAGPGSASATAEVVWDGTVPSGPSTTLTVRTALSPASDAGRFRVTLDGATILPAAGNGDLKQMVVDPGIHVLAEFTAKKPDLFKYAITMTCTVGGASQTVKGTVFLVTLGKGSHADCTLTNKKTKDLHCVVPDVTGQKLSKAAKSLRKAHCAVGSLKPKHPGKKDKVTATSPAVGSVRAEGAKVKLTFG
jgi:hypothetical protein